MYCSKCGAELGTDPVCPECGEQPQKYCSGRDVFSSNLFLAVCVFISLSAILSLFGSFFNIVLILACISVWLVYAQSSDVSRSKNSGFVLAATTLGVEEILLWVVCGLFAVCGPVLLIISVATGSVIDYLVGVGADYGDQIVFGSHEHGRSFCRRSDTYGCIFSGSSDCRRLQCVVCQIFQKSMFGIEKWSSCTDRSAAAPFGSWHNNGCQRSYQYFIIFKQVVFSESAVISMPERCGISSVFPFKKTWAVK